MNVQRKSPESRKEYAGLPKCVCVPGSFFHFFAFGITQANSGKEQGWIGVDLSHTEKSAPNACLTHGVLGTSSVCVKYEMVMIMVIFLKI